MGNGQSATSKKKTRGRSSLNSGIGEDKPKGISVHWLKHGLLGEIESMGYSPSSSVYQIEDLSSDTHGVIRSKGANVMCPRDGRLGASDVDCLEGNDNVGPSTHMLSYSWSYKVDDIAHTLDDYCKSNKLNPKRVYVWICCLCNNQHRVAESKKKGEDGVSFEEFRDIFQSRVTGIGHVLAMMSPWSSPAYLTRVWCIFEFYTANQRDSCKVSIIMPIKEKKLFVQALEHSSDGISHLYKALSNTKVQNAKASEEGDKIRIFKLVENGPGFDALNNAVNERLREWVKQNIILEVAERELSSQDPESDLGFSRLCSVVALVLFRNGEKEQSLRLFKKALKVYTHVHGENHSDTGTTYNNIGVLLKHMGRFDEAIGAYEKATSIRESLLGKDHPDCASSYNNLGSLYCQLRKFDDGLLQFQKGLEVRKRAYGENHFEVAQSYNNLGGVLYQKGEYDKALKEHERGLEIKMNIWGRNHPDTANSFENIGLVYMQKRQRAEALKYLSSSYAIRCTLLGVDHSDSIKVKRIIQDLEQT